MHIAEYVEVDDLPHTWDVADYRALLGRLEFPDAEDIPDNEVGDMALMALQETDVAEAAQAVLGSRLTPWLTPGQIKNCAQELRDEPLWEEFPNPAAHRGLFVCARLLSQAFPAVFPAPSALRVGLRLTASFDCARLPPPVDPVWIVRALSTTMEDRAVLTRMYDRQLAGGAFPEADHILWHGETVSANARSAHVDVWSSCYWMRGLPDEGSFLLPSHLV